MATASFKRKISAILSADVSAAKIDRRHPPGAATIVHDRGFPSVLFLTAVLLACRLPAVSSAEVFEVRNFEQWKQALWTAERNAQADTIQIRSDITLSEPVKFTAEDYPLTIRGNGHQIDGAMKVRCLEIRDGRVPLHHAHVSISDLTLMNGSDLAAGGLLVNYRSPGNASTIDVHHCTFSSNVAKLWEYGWGGGAYLNSYDGDIKVRRCTFLGNRSAGGGGGAKVEASGSGHISISGCRFIGNTAAIWYGGLLAHSVGSGGLEFSGNLVAENTSYRKPAGGVGIWVGPDGNGGGPGAVFNNVVHGNSSPEVASMYLWVRGGNRLRFVNNTIVSKGGNIGLLSRAEAVGDEIVMVNNIVWGHNSDILAPDASRGTVSGGFNCYSTNRSRLMHEKDMTVPPKFIGDGDYHLAADSPCVDTGCDGPEIPRHDLDGNRRPLGRGVDMGAYERAKGMLPANP